MISGRRKLLIGLMAATSLIVGLVANGTSVLRGMASWLDVGERPLSADVVMVLAGGEDHRPFAAAALVRAGYARKVLLAEIRPSPAVTDGVVVSPQETSRRVLVNRGVSADAVQVLPGSADTTYEEGQLLAAYLRDKPHARAIVVTTNLHTRRTRMAFRHAMGNQADRVSFVSAPIDQFEMDYWWRDQWGFEIVLAEYGKLLFYAICYTNLVGYCMAALAALVAIYYVYRFRQPGDAAPDELNHQSPARECRASP